MIDLGEDIGAGLVAKIARELPAYLAEKNAQAHVVADGITADAPVLYLDHVPAIEVQRAWPLVGLVHGKSMFEDDQGYSMTGVHPFVVATFVQDHDQQALTRKIKRLTTCVAAAAIKDRYVPTADQSGRAAWGMRIMSVDWGEALADIPAGSDTPEAWLTWSEITLVCKTDEDA
jgi:hypothetical protein